MSERPIVTLAGTRESRVELRVPVNWRGQLTTQDGRQHGVKVYDVSRSGAGISGEEKLRTPQAVELRVGVPRLPDLDEVAILLFRATVVLSGVQRRGIARGLEIRRSGARVAGHPRCLGAKRTLIG